MLILLIIVVNVGQTGIKKAKFNVYTNLDWENNTVGADYPQKEAIYQSSV